MIEMSVVDMKMTKQEAQIYCLIMDVSGGSEPEAHACRLHLFFITYGCSDSMPYPFDVGKEYLGYIAKFRYVSAKCRLSYTEELFIIERVAEGSPYRSTPQFVNREKFLRAAFDSNYEDVSAKNTSRSFLFDKSQKPPHRTKFDQ